MHHFSAAGPLAVETRIGFAYGINHSYLREAGVRSLWRRSSSA